MVDTATISKRHKVSADNIHTSVINFHRSTLYHTCRAVYTSLHHCVALVYTSVYVVTYTL